MRQSNAFQDLCAMQPQLSDLYQRALSTKPTRRRGETDWFAWASIKAELIYLVGWLAEQSPIELRSSKAYDIAYKELYMAFSVSRPSRTIIRCNRKVQLPIRPSEEQMNLLNRR